MVRSNGLNHRVGWHYDVTDDQGGEPDGAADGDDPWYHFISDDRWRIVPAAHAHYMNSQACALREWRAVPAGQPSFIAVFRPQTAIQ